MVGMDSKLRKALLYVCRTIPRHPDAPPRLPNNMVVCSNREEAEDLASQSPGQVVRLSWAIDYDNPINTRPHVWVVIDSDDPASTPI